jgi:hypothetical protein
LFCHIVTCAHDRAERSIRRDKQGLDIIAIAYSG